MKRILAVLVLTISLGATAAEADAPFHVVCENGVCRIVEDGEPGVTTNAVSGAGDAAVRLVQGYRTAPQVVAFLRGESDSASSDAAAGWSFWALLVAAFLGGLAMNLTPCVLPLVPVTLAVIGRSAARGAAYALGTALAYGALGLAASLGGFAFGTIQSSPWFSAALAVVFTALALPLVGVGRLDFSRLRGSAALPKRGGFAFAFVAGALAAVAAGACVAPALVAVLVATADLAARGSAVAWVLPFAFGLGMGAPWPFAGAGLAVLPRPGAWMRFVNRILAVCVLALAVRYGVQAWRGWRAVRASGGEAAVTESSAILEATPETFAEVLAEVKRPVFVDVTAGWCANCAALEKGPLRDPDVRRELARFTVIRLRAEDLAALRRIPAFSGVYGLPVLAVFD